MYTSNALEAAASTIEERMYFTKWTKPLSPDGDNLVTIVAQPAGPARRHTRDIVNSFVDATRPQVGNRNIRRMSQSDERFVQGEDVVGSKNVGPVTSYM
jgi:hypothetical protein